MKRSASFIMLEFDKTRDRSAYLDQKCENDSLLVSIHRFKSSSVAISATAGLYEANFFLISTWAWHRLCFCTDAFAAPAFSSKPGIAH